MQQARGGGVPGASVAVPSPPDPGLTCFVFPLSPTSLHHHKKLAPILAELLETEAVYVRESEVVLREYLQPLRGDALSTSRVLTNEEITLIFSNLAELVRVNASFLSRCRAGGAGGDGDAGRDLGRLARLCESFDRFARDAESVYSHYVVGYEKASATLLKKLQENPAFWEFCSARSVDLTRFLIKPVQRVLKYPLFFQQMLEALPPAPKMSAELTQDEWDEWMDVHDLVAETKRASLRLAAVMNEAKRGAERRARYEALSRSLGPLVGPIVLPLKSSAKRVYCGEWVCGVSLGISSSQKKTRQCWLFDDVLLVVKVPPGGGALECRVRHWISVKNLTVLGVPSAELFSPKHSSHSATSMDFNETDSSVSAASSSRPSPTPGPAPVELLHRDASREDQRKTQALLEGRPLEVLEAADGTPILQLNPSGKKRGSRRRGSLWRAPEEEEEEERLRLWFSSETERRRAHQLLLDATSSSPAASSSDPSSKVPDEPSRVLVRVGQRRLARLPQQPPPPPPLRTTALRIDTREATSSSSGLPTCLSGLVSPMAVAAPDTFSAPPGEKPKPKRPPAPTLERRVSSEARRSLPRPPAPTLPGRAKASGEDVAA